MNTAPETVHFIVVNRFQQHIPQVVSPSQLSHLTSLDRGKRRIEVFGRWSPGLVRRTQSHSRYSNAAPLGTLARCFQAAAGTNQNPESIPKTKRVGEEDSTGYSV